MTGLSRVFDASAPPAVAPAGCTGVLGYIGRRDCTPHVWTPAEWARFTHLTRFPCWVPNLGDHAGAEAAAIIGELHAAGWGRNFIAGVGHVAQAVVIDYETAGSAEAPWHANLASALGHAGFDAIAYGSLSTVMGIGAAHVWAADFDGYQALEPAAMTVHAHQFQANVPFAGTAVDFSAVDSWLMARGLQPVR